MLNQQLSNENYSNLTGCDTRILVKPIYTAYNLGVGKKLIFNSLNQLLTLVEVFI